MSSGHSVVHFDATLSVGLRFLENLGSVRSLSVHILAMTYLVDAYEPETFCSELSRLAINPDHYLESQHYLFADDYQATVLFSKLPPKDKSDSERLRDAAIASFLKGEERNKVFNERFLFENYSKTVRELDSLGVSIERIKNKLSMILGKAPSLQSLANEGDWSEGASVSLGFREACSFTKSYNGTTCTIGLAKAIYEEEISLPWLIPSAAWLLVPGNLISTVPKNLETDRTIASEPDINMFFQKGIGRKIAKRLRRFGINLQDQSNNQKSCALALKCGRATIDLRNASNSNVLLPIMALLDEEWGYLLEVTRSPYGTFSSRKDVLSGKAEWLEYEMLSSMGNGFTFELETALFFAICLACGCDVGETWVYGDDIIIPASKASLVTSVLGIFGHEVNSVKSFTSGLFYESCGVYYFNGIDVTPLKIKDYLYESKDIIILANKLRLYAHTRRYFDGCDKRFLPAWQMCISRLPTDIRVNCRGPVNSGLCLFVNLNERRTPTSKQARARGCTNISVLVPQLTSDTHRAMMCYYSYHDNLISWSLRRSIQSQVFSDCHSALEVGRFEPVLQFAKHNIVKQFAIGWNRSTSYTSSWYDLGPWW